MSSHTTTAGESRENSWEDVTAALLAGLVVLGGGVFLVTAFQLPIAPPVEVLPLFVWNTTAAVVAFVLLRGGHRWGFPMAVVTGALVVVTVALIGLGIVGELSAGGSPLGPLSYVGLGVLTAASAVAGWRTGAPTGTGPATATR